MAHGLTRRLRPSARSRPGCAVRTVSYSRIGTYRQRRRLGSRLLGTGVRADADDPSRASDPSQGPHAGGLGLWPHDWRDRQRSNRQKSDAAPLRRIRTIHVVPHGTCGAPRVNEEVRADGIEVGRKRVARRMCEAGIAGVSRRRRTVAKSIRAPGQASAGDLVRRDFTADGLDGLWVADITFVPTAAWFLFFAVVPDA